MPHISFTQAIEGRVPKLLEVEFCQNRQNDAMPNRVIQTPIISSKLLVLKIKCEVG